MYWLFIYMMTTDGIFHFVEFMTLLKKHVMQATTFAQDLDFFAFLFLLKSWQKKLRVLLEFHIYLRQLRM